MEKPEKPVKGPSRRAIKLTIGAKLIGLNAVLLLSSITSLMWVASRYLSEDNTALIQQNNSDSAGGLATQTREYMEGALGRASIMGRILINSQAQAAAPGAGRGGFSADLLESFFAQDKDQVAIFVFKRGPAGRAVAVADAFSPDTRAAEGFSRDALARQASTLREVSAEEILRGGAVQVAASRLADGSPIIALGVPVGTAGAGGSAGKGGADYAVVSFARQTRLIESFARFENLTAYLVDRTGSLIAHPDPARVAARENVASLEIVRQFMAGKAANGQTRYVDPKNQEARLGAFHTVGLAGLGVVTEVPEAKAFEASNQIQYRSGCIAAAILALSFLVGYLYSLTLSRPIQRLSVAAYQLSAGDFNIALDARGGDEIAHLSGTFNQMARDLEHRVRVIETFHKFHNKEIAEQLLSGSVNLGGERKKAAIFFSDIRGFTALSESLPPEGVVEMLNEYMTTMVRVIRSHKGIVDKFVGDAIMAVWGLPIGGPDDTLNAVKACLEMREELVRFNERRIAAGKEPIRIGMGLNLGEVIAGNIGSSEKMEYTVIGDPVNVASRIESMTKEYGTDLLVSRSVQDELAGRFLFDQCESAHVKGKSESLELFRVLGRVEADGTNTLIETLYSSYASEKSDKSVHAESATGRRAPPLPPPLRAPSLGPPPFNPSASDPPPFSPPIGDVAAAFRAVPPPFRFGPLARNGDSPGERTNTGLTGRRRATIIRVGPVAEPSDSPAALPVLEKRARSSAE